MTKRSSFVIPPVLADVAVIVDISNAPQNSLMQSPPRAELSRIELWASLYGNIAVKLAPIRLSALCTAPPEAVVSMARIMFPGDAVRPIILRRTSGGLTAFKRARIARLRATRRQGTSKYGLIARASRRDINDDRRRYPSRHRR